MKMYKIGKYYPQDSMSDMICDNPDVLLVMSRMGMGLGFGEATVEEVCRRNGVDAGTFLAIVNMQVYGDAAAQDPPPSLSSLLEYLHNAHDYFLNFRLPRIRAALENVMAADTGELSKAILGYFDEYVAEVDKHMLYEEEVVFPYVRGVLEGAGRSGYNISVFRKRHDQVEARLTEFKQIFIKYYPARSTNEINAVLFDIFNCERDLASHNALEDRLFVPAVTAAEANLDKS